VNRIYLQVLFPADSFESLVSARQSMRFHALRWKFYTRGEMNCFRSELARAELEQAVSCRKCAEVLQREHDPF